MKKFVLLWICALGVCLAGCSDDDTPEQLPDPELTLAPDAPIAFPAEGGNVDIAVTTNMETWSAVSDQEWCKVAASAGKFTVSAVENETLAPMPAATVTVTASTGERSVSRKLQVSQEAGPDPELTLAPDAPIAFPAEGGSVDIAVTTNMETWSAVSDQEWCKVAASAGKFTVSAVENETLAPMPAATVTVTASTGERSVSRKLQVSQEAGKEKIVDLSEAGTSNCYLVTAAGKYSFDATVRGNGAKTEGLDAPAALAGTSAAVVWQSAPNLISEVALADGRISFRIAGAGNAVIAVKDGAILWSWHI